KRFLGVPPKTTKQNKDNRQHVGKCLWCYLKYHEGEEPKEKKGEWLGKIYSEASKKITENPEFKKEVDEIQQKLEAKDPAIMELWKKTKEWSMEEFIRIYKQLGVEFDTWFYDNELIDGAKKIIEELKRKGIVEEDEGALIVSEKKTGLPTFIVEKSDGTTPYITKDLELARRKFEDYKIDKSIYVVAAPQTLHFQQLFKLLELYGFKQAKDCHHLSYELVMMKTGKMSSREGKLILYSELFDTAKKKVLKEIEKRHDLKKTEKEKLAEKIAIGALKYAMLNRDNNKVIYFDWDQVLSFEGNSGPYMQYSLMRAKKIIENSGGKIDFSYLTLLKEDEEFELIKKIYKFPQVIENISNNYKPHLMAEYTFELASLFSKFYERCPVLQSKEKIKKARLALTWGFIQIMKNCFSLLGIEEVDIM
ncbi:MAG: arginine--tRNA ligase, partial [Candidatus Aenigmarchaeota archaeon]|nr:arginine--tRNA ligase [Candidatus Aenigmarchaeota archaeon]